MTCQEKKSLNEQSICCRTSGKSEDKSEDLRVEEDKSENLKGRQAQSNKMAEYPNGNRKSEDLRVEEDKSEDLRGRQAQSNKMAEYPNGYCKGQRTEFCGMTCQEKKSLNEQNMCYRTSGKSEDTCPGHNNNA